MDTKSSWVAGPNSVVVSVSSVRSETITHGTLVLHTPTNPLSATAEIDRRSGEVVALPMRMSGRYHELDYELGGSPDTGIPASSVPINFKIGDTVLFPSKFFHHTENDGHPTRLIGKWGGLEYWSIPVWGLCGKLVDGVVCPLNGYVLVERDPRQKELRLESGLYITESDAEQVESTVLHPGDPVSLVPKGVSAGDRIIHLKTGFRTIRVSEELSNLATFVHRRHILGRVVDGEIEVFGSYLLVDVEPIKSRTDGGLIVPDVVIARRSRSSTRKGVVVKAGPDSSLAPGATILFPSRDRNTQVGGMMIIDEGFALAGVQQKSPQRTNARGLSAGRGSKRRS